MSSESRVQSEVRIEAARRGIRLWRNNNGAGRLENGSYVRFGLANDSPQLNAMLKSGDLIGYETVTITPDMVGQKIARFLSVECKPTDFRPDKSPRYLAQKRWADLVNRAGGRAVFATSREQL